MNHEDFTGGFDDVPEGWTQLQNGEEDNTQAFILRFNGNFDMPVNIMNTVNVPGGQTAITWPVEKLWVGGVAFCRDETPGPCSGAGTCTNNGESSYTCN